MIIASGEIGAENVMPFVLQDTQQTFANKESATAALQKKLGIQFNIANGEWITDHFLYKKMPSLWDKNSHADIAFSGDFGVVLGSGYFNLPKREQINGNNVFRTNNYTHLNHSSNPSLLLNLNKNSIDRSGRLQIAQHQKGLLFIFNTDNLFSICISSSPEEICFFYDEVEKYRAPFGFINENSVLFNFIEYLEPLRIYSLKSVILEATGEVKDAANQAAANCPVRAYKRSTGELIGQGMSNEQGRYRFPISAVTGDEIYMVCLDNDQAPDFEARIIDRIIV